MGFREAGARDPCLLETSSNARPLSIGNNNARPLSIGNKQQRETLVYWKQAATLKNMIVVMSHTVRRLLVFVEQS